MSQQQLQTLGFGSGIIWGFPTGAQTGSNVTPCEIGTLQNCKLDFTADIKELHGLYSYPVDSAIGKRSVKGSAAFAQFEGTTWNNLMFGSSGSVTSGAQRITSYREAWTVPPTSTYVVTVSNSAHFVQDGGVRYASTGQEMNAITSGVPLQGQYIVSNGVYTFAAADAGQDVVITYAYSESTTDATTTYASSIPTTPFQISVPNAGAFVSDGGVRYSATGVSLTVTSGTPSTGQYKVALGVYTFASADVGDGVIITYTYSGATTLQTFTISNISMGSGPIVGLQLLFPYESAGFTSLDRGIFLPNVRFGNLSLATKLDDYTEENTTFQAFANPVTGIVAQSYLPW